MVVRLRLPPLPGCQVSRQHQESTPGFSPSRNVWFLIFKEIHSNCNKINLYHNIHWFCFFPMINSYYHSKECQITTLFHRRDKKSCWKDSAYSPYCKCCNFTPFCFLLPSNYQLWKEANDYSQCDSNNSIFSTSSPLSKSVWEGKIRHLPTELQGMLSGFPDFQASPFQHLKAVWFASYSLANLLAKLRLPAPPFSCSGWEISLLPRYLELSFEMKGWFQHQPFHKGHEGTQRVSQVIGLPKDAIIWILEFPASYPLQLKSSWENRHPQTTFIT